MNPLSQKKWLAAGGAAVILAVFVLAIALLSHGRRQPAASGSSVKEAGKEGVAQQGIAPRRKALAVAARRPPSSGHDAAQAPMWKGSTGIATRSRPLALDPALVSGQPLAVGREISLNLFDDVTVDAVVTASFRNVNGTISTTAKIKDSTWGRVFIAQTGTELLARARLPEKGEIYAIEYNRTDGAHYALQLDPALAEPFEGANDSIRIPGGKGADIAVALAGNPSATPAEQPVAMADESTVAAVSDVMVVYTNGALANAGSLANMNNKIAIGIAYANDAHATTNTGIVLNLVYSCGVTYTETGNNSTDLSWETSGTDSVAQQIRADRNTYGADFVQLINATGSGGVGWQLTSTAGNASYAFSVVDDDSYQSYTPPHEIGHNMGCAHAADQNYQAGPTGGDIGTDAAGWHWHPTAGATGYCSVMTYEGGSYFADGLGHAKVGVFSDPNITDHGMPCGNATTANNARVLRLLKNVYPTYRTRAIAANSIAVDAPKGGEVLTVGGTQRISWRSDGVTGNVKIELYKSGALERVINASTYNDRVYDWTVPADVAGGADYKIKITSVNEPAISGMSDATFTIKVVVYSNTLDTNPGWTITGSSGWAYGAPGGENPTYGGPAAACTGTNIYDTVLTGCCFSSTTLTTAAINCSAYQNVMLKFMGQFSETTGDTAKVQVSNNGTTWTDLYSATNIWATNWSPYTYDISAYADGKSTVYIRWSHVDGTGSSMSGMAIDDVQIFGVPVSSDPSVSFTATSQTVSEAAGTATVTAQLSKAHTLPVTVPFTLSGTATSGGVDYSAVSPITIPAGSTSASASFTIVDDSLAEDDETIVVTMGTPTNAWQGVNTVHTITVTDNDSVTAETASADIPKTIPDPGTTTSSLTVAAAGNVLDVDVTVNLTHTYVSDLTLTLIHPDGTRVTLADQVGGSGQNFTGTVFDQQASTLITAGSAPFTGHFRPSGDLSTLAGKSQTGTWKLEMKDNWGGDAGTLTSWSLTIRASVPSGKPTVSTTAASAVTTNSATAGGNVTAQGDTSVTARGVCWSTSANPTTADSHTSDGTGTGAFTSSLTSLSSATTYHIRAYATNSVGTSYGSDMTFATLSAPTVATAAAATPSTVTGTTTALSVLGADDGGESALTYTWATTGTPPAAVTFSANGTNAAKNATATFTKAGTYNFQVTIKDAGNLTVTSAVSVTVNQTTTTVTVSPATKALNLNGAQTFTASASDQFGTAMTVQPTFAWSNTGVGSINASTGAYAAGAVAGSATITATGGSKSGTASVTVTNAAPTVATTAAATPSTVTGTTTALSVLGADDGGESALTYTWATTGTPPAAVTFSANGTNAAKNATATFTKAGTYNFQVTIKDAGNLTVTSAVSVTVNQTTTTVTVSPATKALNLNGAQTFTASASDQFGTAMTVQPTFAWSNTGVGSINASTGAYAAGAVAGSATITATGGGKSGTASVTVAALVEKQLNLVRGWNLVSLPIEPAQPAVADCFGGAVNAGNVWRWDTTSKQYQQATTVKALEGYWVYAAAPATVTVYGTAPASTILHLATGWNLVGVAGTSTPAAGMQVWGANPGSKVGGMQAVESLDPLAGYWIYIATPTDWDAAGTP